MAMTDPLADLFNRMLNAGKRGHEVVQAPASLLKENVLRVLKKERFIVGYKTIDVQGLPVLEVGLQYHSGRFKKPFIEGIRKISKPGRRVYAGKKELSGVMGGLGVAVLTTSKGILTDQEAKKEGVGGEVLCHIW